jgi:hypothetical protein
MADDEVLRGAMERLSQSMTRAIKQHLYIESQPQALPSRDDPSYELVRAWHRIAEVRRRIGDTG